MALLFAFYVLSYTADEYLSPSLNQISKTFNLSESLAGVTLLAFAAGAPDVFASLASAEGGETEGIFMGISVLLGSSLFILATVTALVIIYSPEPIKLNRRFFSRDMLFLLASMLLLLYAIEFQGKIDMKLSLSFNILYVIYVVVVLVQDYLYKGEDCQKKLEEAQDMVEMSNMSPEEKKQQVHIVQEQDLENFLGD